MAALLELRALRFHYPGGRPVLNDVSLRVERGERVALLGPNGAGKSTLLLHLNGLLLPGAGTIAVNGAPLTEATLRTVRSLVGLVFQNPDDQLFLPTLLEDVAFGPLNAGQPREAALAQARATLDELGLGADAERAAHHLSGGERRLAALATVLVSRPPLLALDEPTSDLDARARKRVVAILRRVAETMIVATHDLEVARALCARAVVLDDGRLVHDGALETLLADGVRLRRFGLVEPM